MLFVEDLMAMFKVQKTTVWSWCRNKKLKYIKIGKRYMFAEKDVNEFIEKNYK